MNERTGGLDAQGEALIAACALVRSSGYAVITAAEKEHRDRWLQEAWDRERVLQDQNQRLLWAFGGLLDQVTDVLAPSRPSWLRGIRSWWHNSRYMESLAVED